MAQVNSVNRERFERAATFPEYLETVDKNISASEQTATDYLTGRGGDLHNVLIDMERADLSFKTMVEVRNKLLDAYREIMRMQV